MKTKQDYDSELVRIAGYVHADTKFSDEAYQTARAALADSIGCAILALRYHGCTKLLGPVVEGTVVPNGTKVPGTSFVMDPIRGAFNIGAMIRWLDYNDTWLAAEWGHPSDNLGAILAVSDYISRTNIRDGKAPLTIQQVLDAMIKAYEIQGVLALKNSFNKLGFDHVILVKIASAAVATLLLGGNEQHTLDTITNAWIDTGPLRTYRHAPNTGSRKSWAAGDATSRGTMLAWMIMQGEMGYPTALSAKKWGFYDTIFGGKQFVIERPYGSYVMENILFKISFPAEFHAQTAVESAIHLHKMLKNDFDQIESIKISTHDSAIRIIDKTGPLHNYADRDHCLQYMIAIGLLKGSLTADDYHDEAAADPRIDVLRSKMQVIENKQYSIDYHDPDKRSIANSISIKLKDGSILGPVEVEYPIGHRRRRKEGLPLLFEKLENNLLTLYPKEKAKQITALFQDHKRLCSMPVSTFMDLLHNPC